MKAKMNAIDDHRSVGQLGTTSNNFACLSSSSLAPVRAATVNKQGQIVNKTPRRANAISSKVAPSCGGRPSKQGSNLQCFKFTNNHLISCSNHSRSRSVFLSSSSSSLASSSSVLSCAALSRSNSDGNTCRDGLLVANNKNNNSSSLSTTPQPLSSSSSSPALQSSQALPLRSSAKISARRAVNGPHGLGVVFPGGQQQRTSSTHGINDSATRNFITLAAVLIALAQLYRVLPSSHVVVSLASAQSITGDNELKPMSTNAKSEDQESNESQTYYAAMDALRTTPLDESWRSAPESMRDLRETRPMTDNLPVNMTNVFQVLFKKRPFSKYWTVEQKWDDLFKRAMAVHDMMRQAMLKNFMRDIEYYADITISPACERDLKYIQSYARQSTNLRWLAHMFDSTGKSEPGMLTGMMANLGHPIQCIRVRAPARPSNDSFDERYFEQQTLALGERFRGKYCVASVRPVLPPKPTNMVLSRFSDIMNASLLSNISYTGEPESRIKQRTRQMYVPPSVYSKIDRDHLRLDQVPFESELYQYLIMQRNFMFTLPRFMGVCYPSSCSRDDVRMGLQKSMDDQHLVVDIEFECEQEETNPWDWYTTPRLIAYVILSLICVMVFLASLTRYFLLSMLQIKRSKLKPNSGMATLLDALDMFSVDKCAGVLFVKTKPASPWVDWTKAENNRSTAIDALRGFLVLILVYSQMTVLGCLPVPFMWSKWSDTMFPFYRSITTQFFINMNIWSEAFYLISAYIIALKVLENFRPKPLLATDVVGNIMTTTNLRSNAANPTELTYQTPNFFSFAMKRYVRLVLPMMAFILFNYIWPRLSNGFVMQDQVNKIMRPCDTFGWTNFLLSHNHNQLNETCLWPSHVSANFFQLHLFSYPLIVLCLTALSSQFKVHYGDYDENKKRKKFIARLLICVVYGLLILLALVGAIYPALQASNRSIIVPFLIDYIDYDNYRRVIEWMVMPTYNHLTSYMFGLGLAFFVIRKRANKELQRMQASQWGLDGAAGQYSQRDGSIESIRSSSTQELHQHDGLNLKQPFGLNASSPPIRRIDGQSIDQKQFNISTGSSSLSEKPYKDDASLDGSFNSKNYWILVAKTTLCLIICLISLTSTWFWNGLGQPMSDEQTFWFVMVTKLVFCSTFAYLFYEHFATCQNSCNPWMITRFLVPIGRMSLTVFYLSWLVIWFDILSSLYQWHPSHYFIGEKYNEIIFITLILAMIIYAAFEGIVKRIQYSTRTKRFRRDIEMNTNLATMHLGALIGERNLYLMKPFESFFDPSDKPTLLELHDELRLNEGVDGDSPKLDGNKSSSLIGRRLQSDDGNKLDSADIIDASRQQQQQQQIAVVVQQTNHQGSVKPTYLTSTGDVSTISGNLLLSDRYKLNAELRANYSFASIGLYESADSTSDLSHHATSDPNDKRR